MQKNNYFKFLKIAYFPWLDNLWQAIGKKLTPVNKNKILKGDFPFNPLVPNYILLCNKI